MLESLRVPHHIPGSRCRPAQCWGSPPAWAETAAPVRTFPAHGPAARCATGYCPGGYKRVEDCSAEPTRVSARLWLPDAENFSMGPTAERRGPYVLQPARYRSQAPGGSG